MHPGQARSRSSAQVSIIPLSNVCTRNGSGSLAETDIKAQIPVYIELVSSGSVQVPYRTLPLSQAGRPGSPPPNQDRAWS